MSKLVFGLAVIAATALFVWLAVLPTLHGLMFLLLVLLIIWCLR